MKRYLGVRELSELATIDEGLQNVLLHVQVVVIDRREGIAENREIFDRFVHAVVVDIGMTFYPSPSAL
jgi:hypothetical protein